MTICTNHKTLCRGKLLHYYVGIYIDGLMQDCYRPIAYVLEILRFCTKPSIYTSVTCFCRHKVPADLIHIYWDYFIGTGPIIESRAGDSVPTNTPDSKIHGTNLGPIWGRQDPGGPILAPWTLLSGMGNWIKWVCPKTANVNIKNESQHNQLRMIYHTLDIYINCNPLSVLSPIDNCLYSQYLVY